jgi:hypothetical protein
MRLLTQSRPGSRLQFAMQRVPERKFDGMIAVFATAEDNNTFSPAQTFRRRLTRPYIKRRGRY